MVNYFKDSYIICDSAQLRHATIAEKYAFLQQLKQENLKWNDNENKIEHIIGEQKRMKNISIFTQI